LIVITHANLARELVGAAEFILGKLEKTLDLSVDSFSDSDALGKRVTKAIAKANDGQGVLILTDMFGGTPNNISLTFLEEGKVEVVTGVNLPMLIKAASSRRGKTLSELAALVCQEGRGAISVAGQLISS
jgi:PTS system mannose-specific IIA component